ncbi:MAG: nitroreductase family protein [Christensenellales bacterium]
MLAARLAPSAMNQQPWKIVADKTSVSILEQSVLLRNMRRSIAESACCMRRWARRKQAETPFGKRSMAAIR